MGVAYRERLLPSMLLFSMVVGITCEIIYVPSKKGIYILFSFDTWPIICYSLKLVRCFRGSVNNWGGLLDTLANNFASLFLIKLYINILIGERGYHGI